jgi:FkbM family methyltransferase
LRASRRLRDTVGGALDRARVAATAARDPRRALRRRRRARFLDAARAHTAVVAVDDYAGKRFLIQTTDPFIGRDLFVEGAFDIENIDNALRILAERALSPRRLVDVGANIGTTTIEILSRLPEATALAFEPEPRNFRLLEQNVVGNDLSARVACHRAAISDRDGEVSLEISPDNPGDHRVRLSGAPGALDEQQRATTTVPAWRLDTLVARGDLPLDEPALVFVDAQGHEAQILAGAGQLVGRVPMVVEFWPYGLRRAGGYDAFLDVVRRWPVIFDIHGRGAARVGHDDLAALGRRLERTRSFTDLLLVPEAGHDAGVPSEKGPG